MTFYENLCFPVILESISMTQNPMIRVAVNITTAMHCPLLHGALLVVVTGIRLLPVLVGSLDFDVVAPA